MRNAKLLVLLVFSFLLFSACTSAKEEVGAVKYGGETEAIPIVTARPTITPVSTATPVPNARSISVIAQNQEVHQHDGFFVEFKVHLNSEQILFVMFPLGETPTANFASAVIAGPVDFNERYFWPLKADVGDVPYTLQAYLVEGENWDASKNPLLFISPPFYLTVVDDSCKLPTAAQFAEQADECKQSLLQQKTDDAYDDIEVEGVWVYKGNELYSGPFSLTNRTSNEVREFLTEDLVSSTTFEITQAGIQAVGNIPVNDGMYYIEKLDKQTRDLVWLLPIR